MKSIALVKILHALEQLSKEVLGERFGHLALLETEIGVKISHTQIHHNEMNSSSYTV